MQKKNKHDEHDDLIGLLFVVMAITVLPAFILYQQFYQYHTALWIGTLGTGIISLASLAIVSK